MNYAEQQLVNDAKRKVIGQPAFSVRDKEEFMSEFGHLTDNYEFMTTVCSAWGVGFSRYASESLLDDYRFVFEVNATSAAHVVNNYVKNIDQKVWVKDLLSEIEKLADVEVKEHFEGKPATHYQVYQEDKLNSKQKIQQSLNKKGMYSMCIYVASPRIMKEHASAMDVYQTSGVKNKFNSLNFLAGKFFENIKEKKINHYIKKKDLEKLSTDVMQSTLSKIAEIVNVPLNKPADIIRKVEENTLKSRRKI